MQSKITGGATTLLFNTKVLNKYDVNYYRCNETGFIQTEEPYWLPEAYSSAITKLDIGLAQRNNELSVKLSKVLLKEFDFNGKFLDYAGGYGLFTRLMRDKGFDFYNTDKYCANLFAQYFDLADLPADTRFEAVTAFEVFEHLANPLEEIKEMLQYSDNLLFSTELQPAHIKNVRDWWYFIPETGQHVSLYNEASLGHLAKTLGYNFYTNGSNLHLFSKRKFSNDKLLALRESFLIRKLKKMVKKAEEREYGKLETRLQTDWRYITDKLNGR